MTPTKKTKTEKILKTQRQKHEKAYEYAARMIKTYSEPLTVDMAVARNNLRFWKPTRSQMQSALHQAVRCGLATKFRDAHYKRIVYAKLDTMPVLNSNAEVVVLSHSDQHASLNDIESAPLDEVAVVKRNAKLRLKVAEANHVKTTIVKATGEPSLILDAIAVYHGYGTTGHVEELIINHLRHARVSNKKLFNALKELFE